MRFGMGAVAQRSDPSISSLSIPGIASAKDGGGHVSPLTCGSHHHPASVPMHISQHGAEYRRRPPSLDLSPKVLPGTLRLMGRKISQKRLLPK